MLTQASRSRTIACYRFSNRKLILSQRVDCDQPTVAIGASRRARQITSPVYPVYFSAPRHRRALAVSVGTCYRIVHPRHSSIARAKRTACSCVSALNTAERSSECPSDTWTLNSSLPSPSRSRCTTADAGFNTRTARVAVVISSSFRLAVFVSIYLHGTPRRRPCQELSKKYLRMFLTRYHAWCTLRA